MGKLRKLGRGPALQEGSLLPDYILEDFSSNSNRVINPEETDVRLKYMWLFFEDYSKAGIDSPTTIQNTTAPPGYTYALKSHFDQVAENTNYRDISGAPTVFYDVTNRLPNWQFYNYTYRNTGNYSGPYQTRGWDWLWSNGKTPSSWVMNRYNRLTFWMRLPDVVVPLADGSGNFQIGTQVRDYADDPGLQHSYAWHGYHIFDLDSMGGLNFIKVVMDSHPTHRVNSYPTIEWGDQFHLGNYGAGNPGDTAPTLISIPDTTHCYMDQNNAWYMDFPYYFSPYQNPNSPYGEVDFYVGGFVFSENTAEDHDHIYSMWIGYRTSTNRTHVGFSRRKDDYTTHYEVRYQFDTPITAANFASATIPSNHDVPPTTAGGVSENCLSWESTVPDWTGKTTIYVGIKYNDGIETRIHSISYP